MKRVNVITRCKGLLAETLDRKAARIIRQVNQAIDGAKDKVAELEEQADELINSLGEVAGADQTKELQAKLNCYIDYMSDADGYRQSVAALERLKEKLNEEVELVPDAE